MRDSTIRKLGYETKHCSVENLTHYLRMSLFLGQRATHHVSVDEGDRSKTPALH